MFRVQYVRSRNLSLREIKPYNVVVVVGKRSSKLSAIGIGLAKKYRDPKTYLNISYRRTRIPEQLGYTLMNTHLGIDECPFSRLFSIYGCLLACASYLFQSSHRVSLTRQF